MKKHIILCGLLLLAVGIQAQSKWTLRQCIDYAVENNIEIKQQALNVKNAEIDLSTNKNSRLPNLSGDVSQSFNFGRSQSVATGIYEDNTASSTSFGLSTSMPLFTGFRIPNQIKKSELDLKAATEGLNKAKNNMQLSVASYYLDVLFKKEILKVYEEQVQLTSTQVGRTEILVESGKVAQSQLYDIKAQLAKDELNVTTAKNALELSLLDLSQALNLRDTDGFDIAEPDLSDIISDNLSSILPVEQVYQMSLGVKPHVKEAEYKLESSRKNLKVAQSGYWPTLSLGASYNNGFNHIYKSNYNNESLSTQLNHNGREAIGLTLSIPIFDRFQTRNNVRSARLDIENQQYALESIKLALYKEIQQAYQSAIAAQSKFSSTEKAYLAANESFKYAQERYDIGKSTVFELNEAQTKLLSSKSDQIQAKYDFLFRAKILDFYSGKEIDIQ